MKYFLSIVLILSLLLTGCTTKQETLQYDVIVVGTDPEGIAAAVTSARAGAKTLLIDSREKVGGLFTLGWLNFLDMNYNKDSDVLLTQGIFKEFYDRIEGISFNVKTATDVFNNMIKNEPNLDLKLKASSITPTLSNNKITGISAEIGSGQFIYNCKQVIDCTQNGDIAAMAEIEHTLGQEDIGGPSYGMAVTQVFKIGGVKIEDWTRLKDFLNTDDDPNSAASKNCAWGFARFYNDYQPSQKNMQLRGLNIARQTDGCIMINALQIFQINPLDPKSIESAKQKANIELKNIIPFLQKEVPGMENIKLLGVAPELYIRESRHFSTEYMLTLDDVLENKDFEDRIALGSYPVDLQGTAPGEDVIIIGNPLQYSIPYRCIVPLKVDNLLIASRAAGYSSLAHGSTRMVPVGMCVAQAAGNAAVMAINNDITVRDIANNANLIKSLQSTLISQGAYLPEFNIDTSIMSDPYYNGLKLLRKYGLIQGRYNNNYRLNDKVTVGEYQNTLKSLIKNDKWNITAIVNDELSTEYLLKKNILNSFNHEAKITEFLNNQSVWTNHKDTQAITRGLMAEILYLCSTIIK
ncbi:FAD-dependent oxidoreductase [Clostridium sp. 'deep sea']|uniref:FAD-dependent oxidoreductase n=1 Tax=Clostridium sp. 'deep sea' TaxID=2779445 RepID=UPI00189693F9|nr:FAD-dependent oxidoreductase [Clostridium sp. 'deep sea']QOR35567.1 FAD-dependent oxidoreductase [Clostridium sp. 'deep sea']